jgi:hypothetical protein
MRKMQKERGMFAGQFGSSHLQQFSWEAAIEEADKNMSLIMHVLRAAMPSIIEQLQHQELQGMTEKKQVIIV